MSRGAGIVVPGGMKIESADVSVALAKALTGSGRGIRPR
jgi:hypothetical protein